MKKIFLILVAFSFFSCCTIQMQRYTVEKGLKSLVYVSKTTKDGKKFYGSGCVINKDKGYILTNKHVVGSITSVIFVQTKQGESYAKIVYIDEELDIAVVQVINKKILSDKIDITFSMNYKQGDMIYILGHPLGFRRTVTSGIIANFIGKDILIDANVNKGNSGGLPLDTQGYLVGLISAMDVRNFDMKAPFEGLPNFYKSGLGYAINGKIVEQRIGQFLD